MKKRPIVWTCFGYIVFLLIILIVKPEWGETLFRWSAAEEEVKKRYVNTGEIQGRVLSVEVKKQQYQIRIRLQDGTVCIGIVPIEKQVFPGDTIKLKGKVRWPKPSANPGEWDGQLYARTHRFSFYMQGEQIQVIEKGKRSLQRLLFLWKQQLSDGIDRQWSMPWSGIMKSILLGQRGEVEPLIKDTWSQAGIAHVIAISGLHLTVLSQAVFCFLKRFQRVRAAQAETMAVIWLYVVFTGGAIATLRAALMFTIQTLAALLNREEDTPTTLALTAGILLLIQPLYLLEAGFWLSFSAVLALRYGRVWIMSLPFLPYRIRRKIAASLAVSLMVTPISLWFFYQSSIWGFVLNFWVLPAMGAVIPIGLASLMLGAIHPALGAGFSEVVRFILWSFQKGSELFLQIPGGMLRGQPSWYKLIVYYLLLGSMIYYFSKPSSYGKKMVYGLCLSVLTFILFYRVSFWRIIYLDVGQGDCAVIEWKNRVWIIDAGPQYDSVLKPYLLQRGIKEIEGVILSHPDWDHIEGLLALSEDPDFKIKGLWEAQEKVQETEYRQQLEQNISKQGGEIRKIRAGYQLSYNGMYWKAISPAKEYPDINQSSLVVQVQIEDIKFLFTGDIDAYTEADQAGLWEKVQILKVAHHGSRSSSSLEFLIKVDPRLAVISCERQHAYGHPHPEVLERLQKENVEWVVTDDAGAVWVENRWGKVCYSTFKEGGTE